MAKRFFLTAVLLAACAQAPVFDSSGVANAVETPPAQPLSHPTLIAETSDGVTVHGYIRQAYGQEVSPTVLLFHQGGASARGEYGEIQDWLASEGVTSIAWDSRAGGAIFGGANRTVAGLPEGTPSDFCDALPDLLAAIDEAEANGFGEDGFVLWGSSYTGALIFHAAAERPELTRGVIAFSPASGGPMRECLAIERAAEVETEMLIFQPPDEIIRPTAAEQRSQLEALGAAYAIVEGGTHGSSTLLDERTGNDMAITRKRVMEWLKRR